MTRGVIPTLNGCRIVGGAKSPLWRQIMANMFDSKMYGSVSLYHDEVLSIIQQVVIDLIAGRE
jgi:sugar (pentulose or hexulose) kinase